MQEDLVIDCVLVYVFRVQEQEMQKQQLCDELEQLKTRQNCREASCQTEDNLQQVIINSSSTMMYEERLASDPFSCYHT